MLFELLCGFEIESALRAGGWAVSLPGLVSSNRRFLTASRDGLEIDIYYQHAPKPLSTGALYDQVQHEHRLAVGQLRPDFVIKLRGPTAERWILVEVKGGPKRRVDESARAALLDLLAYRRDYEHELVGSEGPYGLGIAWGAELDPAPSAEVVLCTPDRITDALDYVTGRTRATDRS